MASSNGNKRNTTIDMELTCPICYGIFTQPKSLPKCAHTFCAACLEMLLKPNQRHMECPQCRVINAFSDKRIDGLQTNFIVQSLADKLKAQRTAEEDGSTKTKNRENCNHVLEKRTKCDHCGRSFCNNCISGHEELLREEALETLKTMADDVTAISEGQCVIDMCNTVAEIESNICMAFENATIAVNWELDNQKKRILDMLNQSAQTKTNYYSGLISEMQDATNVDAQKLEQKKLNEIAKVISDLSKQKDNIAKMKNDRASATYLLDPDKVASAVQRVIQMFSDNLANVSLLAADDKDRGPVNVDVDAFMLADGEFD